MSIKEMTNVLIANVLIANPAYGGAVQAECMMSLIQLNQLLSTKRKVFAVRHATQADLKEGVPVVVVRHATPREAALGVVGE